MPRTTNWKLVLIGLLGVGLFATQGGIANAGRGGHGRGSGASSGKGSGSGSGSASGGDAGGEIEMGDDSGSGSGSASGSSAGSGSGSEIEMGGDEGSGSAKEGDLNADLNAAGSGDENANAAVNANAATPALGEYRVSWRDIVTVIRKPFLKLHRTELRPMLGTTMNDNIVRHVTQGAELAYYLTDVLAIGVEGQYYEHTFEEPFDLVARQARRLPTVNQYNYSGALDFHYVPVYGKFAVVDKHIVTWEVALTAGVGAIQTEVIPRDKRFPAFTNLNLSPNVGADMRFFLAKWLTINAGIRDYMFEDKFEPTMRDSMTNTTAAEAQQNADPRFINNIMFQLSVSFWLPSGFEYHTFR